MKKLVPLKSIYAFVAVAETGSMTDAAEVLYVSHSAVSQAIKALEAQLNRPLFRRVGRRVELNAAGRKYYRQVAPALSQIVEASESLAREASSNRLTLNMVNSLALHWWIPRVPDFQQVAPQIDVRISTLNHVFDLEQEGVDVALIHGQPEDWPGYHCEKLGDDALIMICSPHLLAQSQEGPEQLLSRYPAIYVTNPRRQDDWQLWCQASEISAPPSQKNLTFSTSVQAVQATIRQLGVLITHQQFVRDEIEQGMLTQVGRAVIHPQRHFYLVCSPDRLKQESIQVLRSWLRGEFARS
ncbi:LysR substrate-binding domain-containing protein [Photobacterium sp. TY1-4]|uniref:LysR substrate-binding domain-containing protein n=1 Tax=Photobacterium sp. TY1-4 TaxID=2899122 RepID=UPI0021BF9751|nr:LysR substrate-binding domain-containing protein [Photobacterium sp. TY1-4]UXI03515.1 LysR substrate-binding domain-containing protein [Photobacterium sp. TY1-4]